MITVLCYENCSTCQRALKWLDAKGVAYAKRPIKEDRPSVDELRAWHKQSGLPLKRFFNTSGMAYRALGLGAALSDLPEDEQLRLLASDGMLVKRPLLVCEAGHSRASRRASGNGSLPKAERL